MSVNVSYGEGLHVVDFEIQGSHATIPPAELIRKTVVDWLGRVWLSRPFPEPVNYLLRIGPDTSHKQNRRIQVKGLSQYGAGRCVTINVWPKGRDEQWLCDLECPNQSHARLTVARSKFWEEDQTFILDELDRSVQQREAPVAERSKKARRSKKDPLSLVNQLTSPEILPRFCFELATEAVRGKGLDFFPVLLVDEVASKLLGRQLKSITYRLLVTNLMERQLLIVPDPGEDGSAYFVPTTSFLELGGTYALSKDKEHLEKQKKRAVVRISAVQEQRKKAAEALEKADTELAQLNEQLDKVEESLGKIELKLSGRRG